MSSDKDELYKVQDFIRDCVKGLGANDFTTAQIDLVVEEIFVNISEHAYDGVEDGLITVGCVTDARRHMVLMVFSDTGPEFDPLAHEDPDVSEGARGRQPGGLGIFLIKRNVDAIRYRRVGDRNVLAVLKHIPQKGDAARRIEELDLEELDRARSR